MSARNFYSDYYESGSAARKKDYQIPEQVEKKKKTIKTAKNVKSKANNKNLKVIISILFIFGMTMFLTYRYNVINEKNLESQSLKKELASVESGLITAQIDLEQSTDLNKIESYAKQQLGMQKPGKNQTVYVDTSKNVQKTVESNQDTTMIDNIISSIKQFFSNIF